MAYLPEEESVDDAEHLIAHLRAQFVFRELAAIEEDMTETLPALLGHRFHFEVFIDRQAARTEQHFAEAVFVRARVGGYYLTIVEKDRLAQLIQCDDQCSGGFLRVELIEQLRQW